MFRRVVSVLCVLAGCGNDRAITGPDDPDAAAVVPARVRLLTDAQYANAVHDLLGASIEIPGLQSPGTHPDQFIHDDVLAVDAPLLVQYRIAAETIAHQLELELATPCAATDTGCARAWVDDFAGRAFRRPLESTEREQLNAIYTLGRASGERSGYALVAEAVLQAPSFVYRTELGAAPGEAVELTPHELAAELSFLFLDSIPDAQLWRAANDSTIAIPEVLDAEVDRLLETPRVRQHLTEVVLHWLGVPGVLAAGKDELVFPELTPDLRRSMYAETEAFVADVLWRRDGSLRELLTSNQTFVDAPLAELYGITTRPMQLSRVTLDRSRRGGILTQASILTTLATEQRESIIRRGMFVRRTFLCLPDPGRPPFGAIVAESGFTHAMTESQFSFFRSAHVYCSGCHASIDPAGRALHHYDGIGRWRDLDEIASPVESDAVLDIGGVQTRISDAVNLGRVLADSDHVARCVVDQLANHAYGRKITDHEAQAYLHRQFEDSGRDLVDVFRTLATSSAFRYRRGGE